MTELPLHHPASAGRNVQRYETEIPLLILVILTSIALWVLFALSVVGIFYAVFFAIFFFLAHIALVARLRGSAVKLGEDQMPDLHARVKLLGARLGLEKLPDAYLMQVGGVLNAFATKLFRSNFICLYSHLLEACGDDTRAVDFIIAHELGHVKAGHLRFQWLIAPGRLFPFIGSAYSRAREWTADRYGLAAVSDTDSATLGLTILAAGGAHARRVNVDAMLRQRHDMTSVWMTIGRWMASHPPLVDRIAEVNRTRAGARIVSPRGVLGAAALIAIAFLVPMIGGGYLMKKFMKRAQERAAAQEPASSGPRQRNVMVADVPAAVARAQRDMKDLAAAAEHYRNQTGRYPQDTESLYAMWRFEHPRDVELIDPFDGHRYGYELEDGQYDIWSKGDERLDMKDRMHVSSSESPSPATPQPPSRR